MNDFTRQSGGGMSLDPFDGNDPDALDQLASDVRDLTLVLAVCGGALVGAFALAAFLVLAW